MSKLFSRRAFAALCVGSYFGLAACDVDNFNTDIINEDAIKIDAASIFIASSLIISCLLYTSDAADE